MRRSIFQTVVSRTLAIALFALLIIICGCGSVSPNEDSNTNSNLAYSSPTPNPSPEATVTPTPTGTPPPPLDWETIIRNEEQKLHESKIVFNPPAQMQERKVETIQARISFREIGSALAEGMRGTGKPQEEPLRVSEIMNVTLTGDGNAFLIQRIGEEEQVVAGKEYAQWEWRVTPLESGNQTLTLAATAKIFLPERGEKPIYYKALEKSIYVKVDRWYSLSQFIANNWQWLWAVVVVPLAGRLLWGGWRKRKTRRRAGFK